MTMKNPSDEVARAYDVWADSYDTQANATRDLDATVLRSQDPTLFQGDVLEIGAGTGKNTEWLAPRARTLLALDGSEGMLKRARQRPGVERVRFLQHDLRQRWPSADGVHDTVVCNLVLEHIEDLSFVFAEARRVLRPGGHFYVCELHPFRQLQGSQARFVHPETQTTEYVRCHLHDVSEFLNAAARAGFVLAQAGDWRDPGTERTAVPRLLSLLWRAE
ncbi:methyltransferase domain-containing protein [Pyxidicoccus fallax]|uniref:Methyltransferase domain-containing protein n=2 Tax=Pyxidicoccus fallax TaxID=394095 RepID=A0A848LJF6_9BACT|nr:methyltransferase domain-containing protein [Pyxidicoccus fallax]NPC79858.1 methyltransferase domain-containing protein [Pyxidicoccus fallax]